MLIYFIHHTKTGSIYKTCLWISLTFFTTTILFPLIPISGTIILLKPSFWASFSLYERFFDGFICPLRLISPKAIKSVGISKDDETKQRLLYMEQVYNGVELANEFKGLYNKIKIEAEKIHLE